MTQTAPPAPAEFMQDLIAFIQSKGFIWGPSPEIYGGLSGFYDYAPLGKLLKNNVEQAIRDTFQVNGFWEVECPTVVPTKVWEASGHLGGFSDPLIVCTKCKASFRVDKLLEELFPDKRIPADKFLATIEKEGIMCPTCHSAFEKEIKQHSLMMKTKVGLDIEAYNRPETATTTYLPFPRYFDYFRKKLPFGVFQIGKAYRNEVSPRQFTLRMREFTQAEGQLFIFKDQKTSYAPYERIKKDKLPLWNAKLQREEKKPKKKSVEEALADGDFKNQAYAFTVWLSYKLFTNSGVPEENIRLRQHADDEKAFYADDAWDIEVKLNSFGWTEMCGAHDRTDYDLTQHGKHSGRDLSCSDETHKKEVAHVIEIAFGTDRITFALLDNFYNPQDIKEGKTTFHIPTKLAPIKVAVLPLMKKDGLQELSYEIYKELSKEHVCSFDTSGSIGRRYLRAAEDGTPYCITIDYQTKEDGTVTLRDRDTEAQVRTHKDKLADTVRVLLDGTLEFTKAGTPVQKEAKK
ncbi:glycine--tRNA ligase [Candidatus Woesearchaeota archaeon]|nr:glycine--tRNA ligase [Candidatus Woesearchaeota archaeon]